MASRRQIEAVQYEWAKSEALREWDGAEGEAHAWFGVTTTTLATDLKQFHGFREKWGRGTNPEGRCEAGYSATTGHDVPAELANLGHCYS